MKTVRWLGLFTTLLLLFTLFPATAMAAEPPAAIDLPVTYRDFRGVGWNSESDGYFAHPDFEINPYSGDLGIVQTTLGADMKPVYTLSGDTPTTNGQTLFDMWYNDTEDYNMSMPGTLTFTFNSGTGNYTYSSGFFFPLDNQLIDQYNTTWISWWILAGTSAVQASIPLR